jgi:type II secretory pathway pseudopilin PulG
MIELILVLMILGLSAAIAVPSLAPFSRGRALGDGSAQALALLLHAQDKAVLEGRSIRVEIDPAQGTFVLTEMGPLGYEETAQTVGRSYTLPDSLSLQWETSSDAAILGFIQFDPDASHDPAVMRITSSDGRYVLLGAWGPTERYRIYWPSGQEPPR